MQGTSNKGATRVHARQRTHSLKLCTVQFAGLWCDAIPAHPVAWQFTPEAKLKRKARGKRTTKMAQYLRSVTR